MPNYIIEKILFIFLFITEVDNKLTWKFNPPDEFSVK